MVRQIGIYFAPFYDLEKLKFGKQLNGVEKKIKSQVNTFKSYGFKIKLVNSHKAINESDLIESNFIYIRKSTLLNLKDIFFLRRLKKLNRKIKTIVEIPTFPYDFEIKKNYKLHFEDYILRNFLRFYVDRIVTYSSDDRIFGIKTINLENGIDFDSIKKRKLLMNVSKDSISMIAVASLDFWHGYDRAIKGIYSFYQNHKKPNIILYIVGDGPEYLKYKKLINEYNLQNHVILTGFQSGYKLNLLYEESVIGLDSMGRHRSGIYFNSSLKGKEYCAKGLMIVSGVKTELDDNKKFQYYLRIPADESPVDFEKVLEFYNEKASRESITDIQKKIIEFSKANFDYKIVMSPLKKFIEK